MAYDYFEPGQRVIVLAAPFYGVHGTIVRPAKLLLRPAWLVELDSPNAGRFAIRRTRVLESALRREPSTYATPQVTETPGSIRATSAPSRPEVSVAGQRRASARLAASVGAPLLVVIWVLLPPAAAIAVTALFVATAAFGFTRN